MYARRRIPFKAIVYLALWPSVITAVWTMVVFSLYAFADWTFLQLPFLPVATLGTAVAFYVGFKNNQAYDRFWEGRKIWGGIVNESRSWSAAVLAYLDGADPALAPVRQRLVFRQLAWINALRVQLRRTSRFFDHPARATKRRLAKHAEHMRNDWDRELGPFLQAEEHEALKKQANAASQILRLQSEDLAQLHRQGKLEVFHQVALMEIVRALYGLQGQCERIKNTPFQRQYAEFARWFTRVFVALVPCGLLSVFAKEVAQVGSSLERAELLAPLVISATLIGWVFLTMDGIGDASEDPFERSLNDVPMNALCITIERDLRQMLGESDLPAPEKPIDDVLY